MEYGIYQMLNLTTLENYSETFFTQAWVAREESTWKHRKEEDSKRGREGKKRSEGAKWGWLSQ